MALTACFGSAAPYSQGDRYGSCAGRLRKMGLEPIFREELFGDTSLDLTGREKAEILNGLLSGRKDPGCF